MFFNQIVRFCKVRDQEYAFGFINQAGTDPHGVSLEDDLLA